PGSATYRSPLPAVADYSILVVVGALRPAGLLERLLLQIDAGVRCWSVDLDVSVLDQQLKLFVSRHSAFLSEHVPGQRTLHHSGDLLDTQVVLGPSLDSVCSEVQQLLSSPSRHKLLILAGQFVEDSGDLVLRKGQFSANHLLQIFREEEVSGCCSTASGQVRGSSLTLGCPDYGLWRGRSSTSSANVHINPPPFFPQMEGLQEFTEYLSESLEPDSPFDLLEPPSTVGFLKLARPCCYIFPGGRGDAAFFVNGFNLLVNGGSEPRSCFWKLVRHLDRIDAVLLTHVGVDNLPGLNSLLLRKSAEQELPAEEQQIGRLLSPELGLVFLNAPEARACLLRCCDLVALTLQQLQRLQIKAHSLSARAGAETEPLILFQKMGVGRLELYVLHPTWPRRRSSGAELPLACLASVCALLVWHPSAPQEKIVRVLFPGCTPQSQVLEGLQKISKLVFLQHPVVCLKDLETPGTEREAGTWASQKEEPGPAEPRKKDVKPKPRGTSEAAAKEKKDGSEKPKVRDNEAKSKLMKPLRKTAPRKEEKSQDAGDKKQEAPGLKLKREPKAEPRKGTQSTKAGTKDAGKTAASLAGGSEFRKAGLKPVASLRRDASLPKRAGARGQKEAPLLKGAAPQPASATAEGPRSSSSAHQSPQKVQCEEGGPDGGGPHLRDRPACSQHQPGECGGPAGTLTLHLNGHLCAGSEGAPPPSAGCIGLGGLSELGSAPHDVDLCLVSPCEFHHPRTPESRQPPGTPARPPSEGPSRSQGPSGQLQQAGPGSTSDLLLSTDQGSSTAAELDSEPDPSLSPSGPLLDQSPPSAHPGLSLDPPPAPIKDLPPLAPQPGACMADAENKNVRTAGAKARKAPGSILKGSGGRSRVGGSSGSSGLSTQASSRAPSATAPPSAGISPADSPGSAVYVDLAYLPSGPAASTVDSDFFRRLRSLHYIISGDDEVKEAAMRSILDALLEGKSSWPEVQATLIPTFDSLPMHDWYREAHDRLGQLKITVLGSNSTVAMQEETFPACKVEF
uniref:Microtubule-associated protein 1Sa n=1 Tax=Tetraodon nigroviridis TaxID=99883 RepID=H3CGJ7_TETNG